MLDFLPDQLLEEDANVSKTIGGRRKNGNGKSAHKPGAIKVAEDKKDLADLNTDFAVVRVAGKTRVLNLNDSELTYSTFEDFKQITQHIKKQDGDRRVGLGSWWLNHPMRRQYRGVTFEPGYEEEVGGKYNLWQGFADQPYTGKCDLYLKHVRDNICSGNSDHYEYLLDVMADAVQNIGRAGEIAVVVRSTEEGTGKGVFIRNFGMLFGRHYSHISQPHHLTGKFNAHLERCCVLFADECLWAGDRQHEGILKAIITEPTLMIERKGLDPMQMPNRIHLFVSSNNEWVVPAGPTARRFFVLNVAPTKQKDRKYFAAIEHEMKNGGRNALLTFLQHRKITRDIRTVPQTEALASQKALSRRGIDRLIETVAQNGELPCAHEIYHNVSITDGENKGNGFYAEIKTACPDLKNVSSITIINALKKEWGCMRWKSNCRHGIRFPQLSELRTMFDAKHGKQNWDEVRNWGDAVDEN